jgi:hypothetical protein
MSNILRRPMFRGGRVESRGTGITSNLGYNKGGRVGYQKGSLVGQYGTAGADNRTALTGANILDLASRRLTNIGGSDLANSFALRDFANQYGIGGFDQGTSKAPGIFGKDFFTQEEEFTVGEGDNKVSLTLNDLLEDARRYDREQIERSKGIGTGSGEQDIGGLGTMTVVSPEQLQSDKTGVTYSDLQRGAKTKVMDNMKTVVDSGDTGKNVPTESTELSVEDYIKMLGGDKARRRDVGDMLGRASAAFLKRPARGETRGITEALGDFMAAEAAAGPGRAEKIEQAAAMLDIKDKIESKRSQEQLKTLLGKADYEAMLRLKMSDPKLQSFETNLQESAKSLNKSYKNPGVIGQAIDKSYGSNRYGGEFIPGQKLIEGKFYIQDTGTGDKIVFKVIKGEPQEVHRIR